MMQYDFTPRGDRGVATIEDARLGFRNFSGTRSMYNREGDRNFACFLDPAIADSLSADGFNVKVKQPKPGSDYDEALLYLPVKVRFQSKVPPQVFLITSRGRTRLGEDEINMLDWAWIKHVDLMINKSPWRTDDGSSGYTAYLSKMYVTIEEDELDMKYADIPEVAEVVIEEEPLPDSHWETR